MHTALWQLIIFSTPLFFSRGVLSIPADLEWRALNQSVDGRLIRGVPFARPCFEHPTDAEGAFDAALCKDSVQPGYLDHFAVTREFGGYTNIQWQSCQATREHCLLDTSNTQNPDAFAAPKICSQGSVPRYAIDLKGAKDAIEGFNFARKFQLDVVIKNTGHDWQGHNSGPDSLALWTHHLKEMTYLPDFRPAKCVDGETVPAVTMGAGVQVDDILKFADEHGITIPTAGDRTVGAAGAYLQGGGYSIVSPSYGLAVDRALEFELVTPRGEHLIANRCQNTDLFFALRGGSPGSFGVVLKATVLALPAMKITCAIANFDASDANTGAKVNRYLAENALEWAENGWGYFAQPDAKVHLANAVLDFDSARNSLDNFKTFVEKELDGTFKISLLDNYRATFDQCIEKVAVPSGTEFTTASRLIPKDVLADDYSKEKLLEVMDHVLQTVAAVIIFGVPPYNFTATDAHLTSITPAWRTAVWQYSYGDIWDHHATVEDIAAIYRRMGESSDRLVALTPGSGTYPNIAHPYQPNFEKEYWGPNYARLLEIKNKHDPDHLIDCWQCVGWKGPNDPKYRCYIPAEIVNPHRSTNDGVWGWAKKAIEEGLGLATDQTRAAVGGDEL